MTTDDSRNINTPLARLIFSTQKRLEGNPRGMDWQQCFGEVVEAVCTTMGIAAPGATERMRATQAFFADFVRIPMRDTVYPDVPDALRQLGACAAEIVIWTQGDTVNRHQEHKVASSGIRDSYLRTTATITEMIAPHKIPTTVAYVSERFHVMGRPQQFLISVYDDAIENCVAIDPLLHAWARAQDVHLITHYIRAQTGHRAGEPTPRELPISILSARAFAQAVGHMEREVVVRDLDRARHLVLLDFDGALTDNHLMRRRQAYVMYTCIRALLHPEKQGLFDKYYWYAK